MSAIHWPSFLAAFLGTASVSLQAIERIVADDFCEELDCLEAFNPEELTPREKTMHAKLSAIYRIAHSHDTTATCYSVHDDWRKEIEEFLPSEGVGSPETLSPDSLPSLLAAPPRAEEDK